MKRATTVSLLQAITPTLIFLFMIYHQAECIGISNQKTARLTTFGSQPSNKNNTQPHQPQTFAGKLCKSDNDCAGVHNTSCMRHPDDNKMRCLCGEKKPPQLGSCNHSRQGLHHKCNEDKECIDDAVCKAPGNNTSSSMSKTCECREGFLEDDYECNSLNLKCNKDYDCIPDAVCKALVNVMDFNVEESKICVCKEGFEEEEEEDTDCNSGVLNVAHKSKTILLILLCPGLQFTIH